jgi:sterol-4alpha-carboxylate 3-dehydrogenase (decarboxylating)
MATVDPNFKSLGHVVVVGGCGFLGYHIVTLTLQQYPESTVSALDVRTTNRVEDERVSYYNSDITNATELLELFRKLKPDVVIHTAGLMPNPAIPDSVVRNVNYQGTVNLLDASKDVGVKAFVYTSSSSVIIGDVDSVINADESWPLLTGREQPEFYSRMKVRYLPDAPIHFTNVSSGTR